MMTIEETIKALQENGFIEEWSSYDKEDGPYDLVVRNQKGDEIGTFLEKLSFKRAEETKTRRNGIQQTWYTFFQEGENDPFTIKYHSKAQMWFFDEKNK